MPSAKCCGIARKKTDGDFRADRRWPGGEVAAERLVRRGFLVAREVLRTRKTRMQKIMAWNDANIEPAAGAVEKRIHEVLTATRGPLPLGLLMEKRKSRAPFCSVSKKKAA